MNQEPKSWTLKAIAKVRCPRCGVGTKVGCVDESGRPMRAVHGERIQRYARSRNHKSVTKLQPQRALPDESRMTLEEREAYREKVRNAVSCPFCGAEIGEYCVGRREHRRLSVHQPRLSKYLSSPERTLR